MKPKIYIGIDPGVNFGYAQWNATERKMYQVRAFGFYAGLTEVISEATQWQSVGASVIVRFEDARLRTWFDDKGSGKTAKGKAMGAGAVRVLCSVIETALKNNGIPFEAVPPKNNRTKLDAGTFKKLTGWQERTNEHARDAAMLVFGM